MLPFLSPLTMSNERAVFKAEVAQVERWWKVQLAPSLSQPVESSHIFLPESTVRSSQTTVHCGAGRLEARIDPHFLPF